MPPESFDNPSECMSAVMRSFAMGFECCLPAIVDSYNRNLNVAMVRPAVQKIIADLDNMGRRKTVDRPLISLPVLTICGGGFLLNVPLSKGDTGWIVGADRDTGNFKKSLNNSTPNSILLHRYNFGFFVPDKVKGFRIADEDANALVIQSLDGKTKISLKDGKVKVASPNVEIIGNLLINVESVLTTITGNVVINGNLETTGDASIGGKSFLDHKHTDSRGGQTSAPI